MCRSYGILTSTPFTVASPSITTRTYLLPSIRLISTRSLREGSTWIVAFSVSITNFFGSTTVDASINEGLIRGWGLSLVDVDTISKAHTVTPLSAIQNIYSMVERGIEAEVIPFCLAHDIGVVPFSPIASGFLSGKVSAATDFSHSDDVRKHVPQLSKENIDANRPILDLIRQYAERKNATNAQISLAWMLHKYPNVVPIPGSKNQERILENLDAWSVVLTDEEFMALDAALDALPVHGHRGFVQFEGSRMEDWNKRENG